VSSCSEFFGQFQAGPGVNIENPELIAKAVGREITRVKAGGKVTVDLCLTERNMVRHGYVTDAEHK
jgi:hypothetical protein